MFFLHLDCWPLKYIFLFKCSCYRRRMYKTLSNFYTSALLLFQNLLQIFLRLYSGNVFICFQEKDSPQSCVQQERAPTSSSPTSPSTTTTAATTAFFPQLRLVLLSPSFSYQSKRSLLLHLNRVVIGCNAKVFLICYSVHVKSRDTNLRSSKEMILWCF